MALKKNIREHGKIKLSRYFQEFKKGDKVSVVREIAVYHNFPKRLQGRSGVIESKRGRHYVVAINDQAKPKKFIIEPVHLKRIR